MKVYKTGDKKYPIKITLSNRRQAKVPLQKKFDNAFLRNHGCSIMAEYVALQICGVKKIGKKTLYPIHIYDWHKKNTPKAVKSKVTLKGVATGINKIGKGKCNAKYYSMPNAEIMKKTMKAGAVVIMELGNPIHSITMVYDSGKYWRIDYGKCRKVNVDKMAKKATKNSTYRGMVIVTKVKKK